MQPRLSAIQRRTQLRLCEIRSQTRPLLWEILRRMRPRRRVGVPERHYTLGWSKLAVLSTTILTMFIVVYHSVIVGLQPRQWDPGTIVIVTLAHSQSPRGTTRSPRAACTAAAHWSIASATVPADFASIACLPHYRRRGQWRCRRGLRRVPPLRNAELSRRDGRAARLPVARGSDGRSPGGEQSCLDSLGCSDNGIYQGCASIPRLRCAVRPESCVRIHGWKTRLVKLWRMRYGWAPSRIMRTL